MAIHRLIGPAAARWAGALGEFEKQFIYPLGPGKSFRIDHGRDYSRFYRSLGRANCLLSERDGKIEGVLCAATRKLQTPGRGERPCVYLGDLKIAPESRGGLVLARLVREFLKEHARRPAYAIVMDGTAVLPPNYSGRAGFPALAPGGKLVIWRLRAGRSPRRGAAPGARSGESCFRRLLAGRLAPMGGDPRLRSEIVPQWLVLPDGRACGRLEDTRRAKRLRSGPRELLSAHLSRFVFRDPSAGKALLDAARARAGRLGFPALFVCMDPSQAAALAAAAPQRVEAAATIFSFGLPTDALWSISSSEV